MKLISRFTLITIILIGTLQLSAQNEVPNAEFEEWTSGEPNDWSTSNRNIFGTDFICVTPETNDPYSGNHSIKIQSVKKNVFLVGDVTFPGIITLGEVIIDIVNMTGTVEGGVPVSGYPVKLSGFYKYLPQNGDQCILGIGLTKWNGNSRDTIALSYKTVAETVNEWTEFSIPINYNNWVSPDTMNIMFISSYIFTGMPVGESSLYIDDLWLDYSSVGIQNAGYTRSILLTVSDDGNSLIASSNEGHIKHVEIYSITGQAISTSLIVTNQKCYVNISQLPRGIYIARIKTSSGNEESIKFVRH
jgi:hypothetical protein